MLICKWLSVGDCFWVRNRDLCSVLLSALGPYLMQPYADPAYAASVSVSSHVLWPWWFRKPCFLGVLLPLWLLHCFCLLFYRVPWVIWWETSCLWLSVPRSLTLCINNVWLWSLCLFLSAAEGSFSGDSRTRPWYSRMSLGRFLLQWLLFV